jgi:hypothetical protein
MAGFASKLMIAGVLAGLMFVGRLDAGQQVPAPQPTRPQFTPLPRIIQPLQLAPSPRLPPRFPRSQPPGTSTRPPLPEARVEPFVVCGMTIVPAPVNVDPRFARPAQPMPPELAERFRRVRPPMCSIADARPLRPESPPDR